MRIGGICDNFQVWERLFHKNPSGTRFITPELLHSAQSSVVLDNIKALQKYEPDFSAEVILFIPSRISCRGPAVSDSETRVLRSDPDIFVSLFVSEGAEIAFISQDVCRVLHEITPRDLILALDGLGPSLVELVSKKLDE